VKKKTLASAAVEALSCLANGHGKNIVLSEVSDHHCIAAQLYN
jgi:hypothetical protein